MRGAPKILVRFEINLFITIISNVFKLIFITRYFAKNKFKIYYLSTKIECAQKRYILDHFLGFLKQLKKNIFLYYLVTYVTAFQL